MEPTWVRFGREIRRRRTELGLTQAQLAVESGLSGQTIHSIETGKQEGYKPLTLAALETALMWQRGSCEAVLAGKPPTPVPDVSEADLQAGLVRGVMAAANKAIDNTPISKIPHGGGIKIKTSGKPDGDLIMDVANADPLYVEAIRATLASDRMTVKAILAMHDAIRAAKNSVQ
jgi:DNA-binding XRE family transcriptional regulator